MAKCGIIHDYDLWANQEKSARGIKCAICDTEDTTLQWSDYAGEAMCKECGCPYQLKWGSDEQKAEGKYPYLNLKDEFLHISREYWQEEKAFVHYGMSFSCDIGIAAFNTWLREKHPELLNEEDE